MEDGIKRKRVGLSLKSSKRNVLESSKSGLRQPTEELFSIEAKAKVTSEYPKIPGEKCLRDGQNSNSTRLTEISEHSSSIR